MKISWFRTERFTLHIEPDALRGMVAVGKTPQRWESVSLPEGTLHNDSVVRPKDFIEALDRLREALDVQSSGVHVSFRHRRAILRLLNLPDVPEKMLGEAVRREARREFPLSPDELYLSWRKIDASSTSQGGVFAVGIPRNAVDVCVNVLKKAGLKPLSLDLKSLALARAVHQQDVLVLDMEPSDDQLILLHDFVPCMVRTLNRPAQASLSEEATQLMSEIQRVINYCKNNMRTASSDIEPRLCLVGASPKIDRLAHILDKRWEIVDPDPAITLPDGFPVRVYLANIGLMLKEV